MQFIVLLFFGTVVRFGFIGLLLFHLLEQSVELFEYYCDTCEDEGSQSEVRIKVIEKSRNDKIQPFKKQKNYNQKYRI